MASKEKNYDDLIVTAQERFRQAIDAEDKNRARAIATIRFIDLGEQWDQRTKKDREDNDRPCLVINKVQQVCRKISNDARQNKPRIKVRPNDSKADPKIAELLNGLIRNIENASDADAAYDLGIDQAIKSGWGYWHIVTEYCGDDVFEQDIRIKRIVNQFSVYMDPSAKEADRSDAQWCFITEVMERKAFEKQYPKADSGDWEMGNGEGNAEWFTDDTVRVASYYYKEPITKTLWQIVTLNEQGGEDTDTIDATGLDYVEQDGKKYLVTDAGVSEIIAEREVETHKIMWCKLAGGEVIEGPIEQAGKYIPVVCCVGDEAWIEGEPVLKSAIFDAMDAQRLYNWARSNAVETLALSPKQPFIGTEEMFEGHEEEWDNANRTPKMRLTANFDNNQLPQRQPLSISDTGALQEAMQSADDIKATTGIYDASLGAQSNETSGKAIVARQRQSDNATFHFPDNQARAIKFTGRILVDLIPKIYDTERVVRLLNQDGSESWSEINKRVPDPTDPRGYRVINDLSVGKYDVSVDVGPGYMTKRIESAEGMTQFLAAAPQTAPVVLPRIAKNLDWPEADEIAAELQKVMAPPGENPQQQQMQKMAMQLQMQTGQLELMKKQLEIKTKGVELQGKEIKNAQDALDLQQDTMAQDMRTYQIAQQATIDAFRRLGLVR